MAYRTRRFPPVRTAGRQLLHQTRSFGQKGGARLGAGKILNCSVLSTPLMRTSTRPRCMATEVGTYSRVREHEFWKPHTVSNCVIKEAAFWGAYTRAAAQEATHNIVAL
jgi:hypothetical protein